MSKTLCYTGINALPSYQHTIPEFMDIMNTNEKHYCSKDKARKKCIDCAKATRLTSKYLNKLSATKNKKVYYPFEELRVLHDKCDKCIQKHINSMPSCNLKEYINYSGAIRGKCPPTIMAPGGIKIKSSSTTKSKGVWNKLKSFIGAGRFQTRRYKDKKCKSKKCKSKKCKHKL